MPGKRREPPEDFEDVKKRAESFYKTIGEVYCPYLTTPVHFSQQGLSHLKFKKRYVARSRADQYERFKILHLAPRIIECSSTVQFLTTGEQLERVNRNSEWQEIFTEVIYYAFIAVEDGHRVRVVVKRLHGAEPHFWGIRPDWRRPPKTLD